jgi:hypothetical protein
LIGAVITTVLRPNHRPEAEPVFAAMEQQGKADLVAAIRRIFDGERDAELLCERLGFWIPTSSRSSSTALRTPPTLKR